MFPEKVMAVNLHGYHKQKQTYMKRNSIIAFSAMLIFSACSNSGSSDTENSADTSMSTNKMDTMSNEPGAPTSGNGNTASGTSNAAPNLTDTAAIGTNRKSGRDSSQAKPDSQHRMKH